MTAMKNLILHVTSQNPDILRDRLHRNESFALYYDGWEATCTVTGVQSTWYYYYDVPHEKLTTMLRFLQANCEGYRFQVKITQSGNHVFD